MMAIQIKLRTHNATSSVDTRIFDVIEDGEVVGTLGRHVRLALTTRGHMARKTTWTWSLRGGTVGSGTWPRRADAIAAMMASYNITR